MKPFCRPLFIGVFFLLSFFSGLLAFQWPVKDIVLKQTFGENGNGSFISGVVLGGNRQEVRPVEEGEIIFYFDEEQEYAPLPSGLGNFVVLKHNRNLFSIYSHLELDPDFDITQKSRLTQNEAFAMVGQTGSALGRQLNLEIIDLEFNQMVNPLKTLPPLPDNVRPSVGEVYIRNKASEWIPLESGNTVEPGEYELSVEIWDQSQGVRYYRPMAPYRINIFANGEEIFFQTFDALESKNGRLYLVSRQNQRTFEEMYTPEGDIFAGQYNFPPGETSLEIIVADFQENRSLKTLKFQVGRPY